MHVGLHVALATHCTCTPQIEMSSLTGESDAIECTPEKKSDMPTEARNVIFNSSLVMNGDVSGPHLFGIGVPYGLAIWMHPLYLTMKLLEDDPGSN